MAYNKVNNDEVVAKIVDMLEKGTVPWERPWSNKGCSPMNGVSGHEYRGLNFFLCAWLHPEDPRFYTANQFIKMGGRVPKEIFFNKFVPISFWKPIVCETDRVDENGEPVFFIKWTCKNWRVYNYSQIEWLKGEPPALQINVRDHNPNEEIENFINASGLKVNREAGQTRAFYRPSEHQIHLPIPERFKSETGFYATVFHEMIHATGHKSILNRDLNGMFGGEKYAVEELIAEMGSAFLCARFGVDNTHFNQSAAYIASWLEAIKEKPSTLQKAASAANKAVDYLLEKFEGPRNNAEEN